MQVVYHGTYTARDGFLTAVTKEQASAGEEVQVAFILVADNFLRYISDYFRVAAAKGDSIPHTLGCGGHRLVFRYRVDDDTVE